MNVLFIIPARGGSKGLPGKNIKPLLGKPLLAWSVEVALKASQKLAGSKVIVSTDSREIADIAAAYGAEVPFMRPAELASDTASSIDVIMHAIHFYENNGITFSHVAMIEPTSPQRSAEDLLKALDQLDAKSGAESIVGVCRTESCHPLFLTKLQNGFLVPYENKEFKVYRRQDIDEVFFFEGSLYISKTESIKERKSFYHEKTLGYVLPKWKSFEIDDLDDFIIIEALMKNYII